MLAISKKGAIKVINVENGICLVDYDLEQVEMKGWHDNGASSQEEDLQVETKKHNTPVDFLLIEPYE